MDTTQQEKSRPFAEDAQGGLARLANTKWLHDLAAHHERHGEPVWALLYRNDAARTEEAVSFLPINDEAVRLPLTKAQSVFELKRVPR